MTPQKILGKTGVSLADSYDVEGSIAGVELLDAEAVKTVHEMGGVQFSERLAARIVEGVTGDTLQSVAFVAQMSSLPMVPCVRVMGITVTVDTVSRVTNAVVSVTDEVNAREIPLWAWDATNIDVQRFFVGGALGNQNVLRPFPEYTRLPYLLVGTTQAEPIPSLNLRGTASAFGAGTVELTLHAHVIFPEAQGLSSAGIPIPSW